MSMSERLRIVWLGVFVCCLPSVGAAQDTPLALMLPELLGNTITLAPSTLSDQPNHIAHFRPGSDQLQVPTQVNQALLSLLSTYPLGSPSGGFTYTLDPALGTFTRTSSSFGPSFAERALTTGRGKASVGFGFQHTAYDTFEGLNLRLGEVKFYIPHLDCCSRGAAAQSTPDGSRLTPPFEGDLIQATLSLNLVSDTSVVFATYGVSDRLDIGVAVPFVHVELDARVRAEVERLATASDPTVHTFEGSDPDHHTFLASGVAGGLGDILLRAKYGFASSRSLKLAAAVEARVPTGDESNLLGTGGYQTKVFGIASWHRGPVSPHVNVGYTFSSQGTLPGGASLPDEVLVTIGADGALSPRVSMAFDVIGRSLLDAGRMELVTKTFEFASAGTGTGGGSTGGGGGGGGGGGSTPVPTTEVKSVKRDELQFFSGNRQLYIAAAGIRFSPWRTALVSANLLFPLTESGLRDRVTPVIGFDWVF